jgi:hypothetical protein
VAAGQLQITKVKGTNPAAVFDTGYFYVKTYNLFVNGNTFDAYLVDGDGQSAVNPITFNAATLTGFTVAIDNTASTTS